MFRIACPLFCNLQIALIECVAYTYTNSLSHFTSSDIDYAIRWIHGCSPTSCAILSYSIFTRRQWSESFLPTVAGSNSELFIEIERSSDCSRDRGRKNKVFVFRIACPLLGNLQIASIESIINFNIRSSISYNLNRIAFWITCCPTFYIIFCYSIVSRH